MNQVVYVDRAAAWAKALEDRERARSGTKLPEARAAVAQRIGVPPGTLRNLRKQRVKGVAAHWYERLRAAVVHDLQAEMARLQHEQDILTQAGVDPRSNEAAAVVAGISAVRAALGLDP
jgi:transposase-like protein